MQNHPVSIVWLQSDSPLGQFESPLGGGNPEKKFRCRYPAFSKIRVLSGNFFA